jgi:hypothetical protein
MKKCYHPETSKGVIHVFEPGLYICKCGLRKLEVPESRFGNLKIRKDRNKKRKVL